MKVVLVHGHMFSARVWDRAALDLAEAGIELIVKPQWNLGPVMTLLQENGVTVFIGELSRALPNYDALVEASARAEKRIGLGLEMPPDFSTYSGESVALFLKYTEKVSLENYTQGVRFLAARAGSDIGYDPPAPVRTHGMYHPGSDKVFGDPQEYLDWHAREVGGGDRWPMVGVLCHHRQIVEENRAEIDAAIRALEGHELTPFCVFSEGMLDASIPIGERYPWLDYFGAIRPGLHGIMNMLGGRFLSRPEEAPLLMVLDVPIFQLIRVHGQTPDQWQADPAGLSAASLVYALSQPEMAGVIEPTVAAGEERDHGNQPYYAPLEDRLDRICQRIKRWVRLQTLSNSEKRITFVLHNNPCQGVEATVGLAVGLEAFESLIQVLQAMKQAGYDVGEPPATGRELLDAILDKKAVSEFRWTTVDEIVRKGGHLHLMGRDEYEAYFQTLPEQARKKLLADWGPFPGEGMSWSENGEPALVITGLAFGKVRIMAQPKRGCYGSKCTGEVCRILHDPGLSPPHHWLASYKYIRDSSDAVIHFGAEGALEYLPGKRAAQSRECFPDITLGDLPNLYVYVMDMPGEGLTAKRRGKAVVVDHLTPVYRPVELDEPVARLESLVQQYQLADQAGEAPRLGILRPEIIKGMKELKLIGENDHEVNFEEQLRLVQRQIALIKGTMSPDGDHVLGQSPAQEGVAAMLAGMFERGESFLSDMGFEPRRNLIQSWMENGGNGSPGLDDERRELAESLCGQAGDITSSVREIPQLLRALNGRFIEPGLGGSLSRGQVQAVPTGRNFFATDLAGVPTRAAWEIGQTLANNLLLKYLEEEGRFPETVGLSVWSSDAFKSQGEVFCQVLCLLGARPVWDDSGRVRKVEAIDLDDLVLTGSNGDSLARPRVDVLIQTSGVMRDMVPHFCQLLDQAAVMVGNLDEPDDLNHVKRHINERVTELAARLGEELSESELKRRASFRLFSSAPGTYGLGVGLALDASAWETESDLAEAYINWGGFAYGATGSGVHAGQIFGVEAQDLLADQLQNLDVSYMRQASPEWDLLDEGGYAIFQGGMAVAAQAVGGRTPKLYFSDVKTADLEVRDLQEDLEAASRAKLFNPKWIDRQKTQGFHGAGAVSSRVNTLFKWSATTRKVEAWVFDQVAATYIQNQENLEWLRRENPYALEELTRRLLEAESRGLWDADPDLLAAVQSAALAVEGDMEETIGEVNSDFQGGRVEIFTRDQVEVWNPKWRLDKKS